MPPTLPIGQLHPVETLLRFTLLQLMVIILAARVAGFLAQRAGQPRGVGEIIAGLLLGPSLFGALAPDAFHAVFRSVDAMPLTIMSQIGLILLMFQVGMEFDFSQLGERRNRRAAGLITLAGILLPFMLGLAYGLASAPHLAPGISPLAYSLFIAIALSITAVPILGRILMEFGLTRSRLGVIAIAAAAANDAIGWVLLAVVAAVASNRWSGPALAQQLGWLLAYLLISWYGIRPILRRLLRRFSLTDGILPKDLLGLLLLLVFGSAMVTSELGIFAIFGGFTAGVLLHDQHALVAAWRGRVGDWLEVFFLPIFFTYTGLRTNVLGLSTPADLQWLAVFLAASILGKIIPVYCAARLTGFAHHEATILGSLMNTRALMELIVLNIGYDLGFIPQKVFTMLVIMAVVTTVMTGPLLKRLLPKIGHAIPQGIEA